MLVGISFYHETCNRMRFFFVPVFTWTLENIDFHLKTKQTEPLSTMELMNPDLMQLNALRAFSEYHNKS